VLQWSKKLVKGQAGDISGKNASNGRLPDWLGRSADRPFEDKDADFSSESLISKNLFSRALRQGLSTRKTSTLQLHSHPRQRRQNLTDPRGCHGSAERDKVEFIM